MSLPAAEREALLDRACGDDQVLRATLQRILGARQAARFFSTSQAKAAGDDLAARAGCVPTEGQQTADENGDATPATEPPPAPVPSSPGTSGPEEAQRPGTGDEPASSFNIFDEDSGLDTATLLEAPGGRIGPYELVRVIGEGGFGRVFLAMQERPVRRRVALKIIRLGMDTRSVIARFEAERQALALMDHPSIAKVFDAGSTIAGRPYFVMELVEGVPITEFCDAARLDVRARLALFRKVCLAVQHAHQKGVIHRDLKPSNILVARHDGEPTPKVIDFGIAKATHAHLTDRTIATAPRMCIGTPAYMSPEQADMARLDGDVDTRADVYALGIVLYELLTGTTPVAASKLRGVGLPEMQRLICDVPAQRPSSRLTELAERLPEVAAARGSAPERLGRVLRGDLDWIVLKALEKDRNRRYESASAFAADVGRYLANQPVEATPPTATYRLGKFVQRNRRAVIAGGALAATLVLGLIGTTTFAVVAARRAEHSLEVERFLRGLFGVADPTVSGGAAASADLLDNARRLLPEDVGTANQVLLSYAARLRIAGRAEEGVAILEGVLEDPRGIAGSRDEAGTRMLLALLLSDLGRSSDAVAQALAAVDLVHAAQPGSWNEGVALRQLGEIHSAAQDPGSAFRALRDAAVILEAAGPPPDVGGPPSARFGAGGPEPPDGLLDAIAAREAAAAILETNLDDEEICDIPERESFLRLSAELVELHALNSATHLRIERSLGSHLFRHGGLDTASEACDRFERVADIAELIFAANPRAHAEALVQVLPRMRGARCFDQALPLADRLLALVQRLDLHDRGRDRIYDVAQSVYREAAPAASEGTSLRRKEVQVAGDKLDWARTAWGDTDRRTLDCKVALATRIHYGLRPQEKRPEDLDQAARLLEEVLATVPCGTELPAGEIRLLALNMLAEVRTSLCDSEAEVATLDAAERAYRMFIDEQLALKGGGASVKAVELSAWAENWGRMAAVRELLLRAVAPAWQADSPPSRTVGDCLKRIRHFDLQHPSGLGGQEQSVAAALYLAREQKARTELEPRELATELLATADWLFHLQAFEASLLLAEEASSMLRPVRADLPLRAAACVRIAHCMDHMGRSDQALERLQQQMSAEGVVGAAGGAAILDLAITRTQIAETCCPGSRAHREACAALDAMTVQLTAELAAELAAPARAPELTRLMAEAHGLLSRCPVSEGDIRR